MLDSCEILDLGRIDFKAAWALQLEHVAKRARNEIEDTLLLCEHAPVYTFGRSVKEIPIALPFPAYGIERGGKGTYHGPGQLVIYPIVKLPGPIVLKFIRKLEGWTIDLLAGFGLDSGRRIGETGVWTGKPDHGVCPQLKIASIGIAVKHWVTYHGVALNVNPDLEHFRAIQPCGYEPETMTSLKRELGREITVDEVKQTILARKTLRLVEAKS